MIDNERLDTRASTDFTSNNWVQKAFQFRNSTDGIVGTNPDVFFARAYTTAMMKFTDTTPGGNLALNPAPQASRWTDPHPYKSKESPDTFNTQPGMGAYYSEMFDDNQQIVYFRFGVPIFNSLTGFYSRYYSPSYARLVRTGGWSNTILGLIGKTLALPISAPLRVFAFFFETLGGVGDTIESITSLLAGKSSSLYYFKPTMYLYWSAAQAIVNHIAVNKGFIPPLSDSTTVEGADGPGKAGNAVYDSNYDKRGWQDETFQGQIKDKFRDIVTDGGNINLYGVATRAQRAWLQMQDKMSNESSMKEMMINAYHGSLDISLGHHSAKNIEDIESKYVDIASGNMQDSTNPDDDGLFDPSNGVKSQKEDGLGRIFWAAATDGGEFVGFRVNSTGGAQESFSNSFKESPLGQWINSTSSSARSAKFTINYGNISENPIFKVIGNGISGIAAAGGEILESLGLGGLGVLAGNAYADLPKFWDNADVQLSTKSYTIDLVSYSGDVYSQMIRIYMPLACLLAGALPRSTGRHSYTEPFLCQVFDKGRAQTRLGMIKSMSVSRGQMGNVAWTNNHEPLNVRVTLDVEDMSSVMHMPLSNKPGAFRALVTQAIGEATGNTIAAAVSGSWFDMESTFVDYMAVLGSLDWTSQIYFKPKILRKWRLMRADIDSKTNIYHTAMAATHNIVADVARWFVPGTFERTGRGWQSSTGSGFGVPNI